MIQNYKLPRRDLTSQFMHIVRRGHYTMAQNDNSKGKKTKTKMLKE